MVNIPTGQQMRNFPDEITFRELIGYLWRGKYTIIATTLLCVIFAYSYISDASVRYRAHITITEASSDFNATSPSTGNSSVVNQLFGAINVKQAGSVELIVEMMSSLKTAQVLEKKHNMVKRIYADQWNQNTQNWNEPEPGLWQATKIWFDIPYWAAPDAANLAGFIKNKLVIEDVTDTGFKKISFRHENREFAREFLYTVFKEADELARQDKKDSLLAQKNFLERRIEAEKHMLFKQNLLNLLLNIEQRIMLISTDQPYIAQILDGPTVGNLPVEPRPNIIFFLAVVIGVALGFMISVCIGLVFYRKPKNTPDAVSVY